MAAVPFSQCSSRRVFHAFARPRANRRTNDVTPIHAKVFDHDDVAIVCVAHALGQLKCTAIDRAGFDGLRADSSDMHALLLFR
ncbi:hypothetical protein ACEPT7_03560 [Burkholderia ubonensis]|uniref:hypothetical protein n=1 Tax=Burkholderia ubonensis TaxID=101571 RepID=UPI00358FB826